MFLNKYVNHLVAILTLFSATVMFSFPMVVAATPVKPRIMVFGDSLSAAYGIQPEQGWVALLAQKLKPDNIDVVNASITGETTLGGLSRLPSDLARHKPTLVLIELGANDGLRGLPVADSRKNLDAMIKLVKASNATPILIGIQIPPNYGIDYAKEFKAQFPALAKQYKIPLVPFLLEGIADKPEKFQPDHLHPKADAQPVLLKNVWPVIAKLIKK